MLELGIITTGLEKRARELARAAEFTMPEIRKGAQEAAQATRDAVRERTPKRTGRTRESVVTVERRISSTEVVIGIGAVPVPGYPPDLFAMLNEGTRPHVIRVRRKRALAFQMGGRMVFPTRVQHPGTRAYRQVERGLEASEAARSRAWRNTARRIRYRLRGR